MTLTPLDIHNKEFNRSFRGYSEAEVDEFLDQVVKEFEALIRENAELKDRLDEVERVLERYRSIEETLNKTLLLAQQAAEDAKNRGEKEADLIRDRARMDAERVVDQAKERARQALEDYAEIRREAELFRMRMKTLLNAQLELFEEREKDREEAPESPFTSAERTEILKARYGDAGGDVPEETAERPDGEAVPEPDVSEEPAYEPDAGREQAAASETDRAGAIRPNLWGEPAEVGAPERREPSRPFPPVASESHEEKDEKGW